MISPTVTINNSTTKYSNTTKVLPKIIIGKTFLLKFYPIWIINRFLQDMTILFTLFFCLPDCAMFFYKDEPSCIL